MTNQDFAKKVDAVAAVLGAAAPLAAGVPFLAGAMLFTPTVAEFVVTAHAFILKAKPEGMTDEAWLSQLADPTLTTSPDEMYQQAVVRLADAERRAN